MAKLLAPRVAAIAPRDGEPQRDRAPDALAQGTPAG